MISFTRTYRSASSLLVVLGTMLCLSSGATATARQAAGKGDPEAAKIKNPVASTPESIAAGKTTFATMCASCHGEEGKGGIVLSVIEDKGGTQPPALSDDTWDHGSSDGEIFTVVKKGVGPDFFMTPFDGRINDTDIWNTVNYLKSLSQKK
jgi:mono/diheme cytochrome c family protein